MFLLQLCLVFPIFASSFSSAAVPHNRTSVLVIDIQNDYFSGGGLPLVNPVPAAKNAEIVLEAARKVGAQVVYMQHQSLDPHSKVFRPGTWGDQINDIVKPQEGDTLVKNYPNSYRGFAFVDSTTNIVAKYLS